MTSHLLPIIRQAGLAKLIALGLTEAEAQAIIG